MKRYKPIRWAFALLALGAALLIFGRITLPAAAETSTPTSGIISGVVTSPFGYPLPAGTVVKLLELFDNNVHGQAIPDLNDGSFSLGPAPNGLYVLKAVPPEGNGLTQSLSIPVSVVNAPVNVGSVALTTPQIVGTVTAPDGVTLAEADVIVRTSADQVSQKVDTVDGTFEIGGLPDGNYLIEARPVSNDPYWNSLPAAISISGTTTHTLALALTEAQLWGIAEDPLSNPIPFAAVIAAQPSGNFQTDHTNASGFWSIGGLPEGEYRLNLLPPLQNNGLIPPAPIVVTIPGAANPYTLTFEAPPKTVTGTVTTNTGLPVENAEIIARRTGLPGQVQTLTGSDGAYQLNLSSGLWTLSVHPISTTVPADWVYPLPPQLVYFAFNPLPESTQQDFTVLTADATATGLVAMPDASAPPFTVTVGLYNGEGIGHRVEVDASGAFTLALPNGNYDVVVWPQDEGYLGPAVDPVTLPANGTLDLGILTLQPRDALITGTLTTEGGTMPVEGIPLVAWRPGIPGSLHTATGPGGMYALAVTSGTWQIQPAPGPNHPYLYTGSGQLLTLEGGEVVPDVNFDLLAADATITGVLVDENGDPAAGAQGWAAALQSANPTIHNGAPIQASVFSIYVPAGTYQVTAYMPPDSLYMSTGQREVSVAPGGTAVITLTVQTKDAVIEGMLWDPRNNEVVSGVPGEVGAWGGGSWTVTPINPGNGAYLMQVAAGLWQVNYRMDQTDYVKAGAPMNIPVESGQTVHVPLRVLEKDAAIEGIVLDPDGNPLPGATVLVRGQGHFINRLSLSTQTAADGSFRVEVPFGHYRLGATLGPGSDWIHPVERVVGVLPGSTSGGHVLQFQEPDAVLEGSLTVTNTLDEGPVYIWAWSDDGGFTSGMFPVVQAGDSAVGVYSLDVISGTTWHLGAVFETNSEFWKGHATVELNSAATTLDLSLLGPFPKPGPVVVTFDAANPQNIMLADGTQIFVPAGAMPVNGMVTLHIVPIATLPQNFHASVLTYGYAFHATDVNGLPIESSFNQDVIIRFAYHEASLNGLPEPLLKPAYFSTTTNQWTIPESYVVDTAANVVVMQIDHFTHFALLNTGETSVYLPAIIR